jgi:hypothetical protein
VTRIDDATPETGSGGSRFLARFGVPLGILAGCAVFYVLARVFAVPVEVWDGPNTFTQPRWLAMVALVPAVAGLVTGFLCGHLGKWYAMIPVGVLHTADYYVLVSTPHPDTHVLGAGLFVFFMIVMVELALMGGWIGEMLRGQLARKDLRA